MDFDSIDTITCPACGPGSVLVPRADDPQTGRCQRCSGTVSAGESATAALLGQSLEWDHVRELGPSMIGSVYCPLCGQRTTLVPLAGAKVDVCTDCELLWRPPAGATREPVADVRRVEPEAIANGEEQAHDAGSMPLGKALGAIIAVLLLSLALFVAPLAIDTKVYVFLAASALAALLLGGVIGELAEGDETGLADNFLEGWFDGLTGLGKLSSVLIVGAVFWCGTVMFWQYWTPGGADPYYHDITVTYVAALAPLLFIWWSALLLQPTRRTLVTVARAFRFWVFGYGLVLASMLVWVIFDA